MRKKTTNMMIYGMNEMLASLGLTLGNCVKYRKSLSTSNMNVNSVVKLQRV